MIVLVDLGISNIGSVRQALARVGCPTPGKATASTIARASAVIIPGVGSFAEGMKSLRAQGLIDSIRRAARSGVPTFGICLGMQLLASESEEHGLHEGLGLIEGRVVRLRPTEPGYHVPNIGWCDVRAVRGGRLFNPNSQGCFYHVHSYHLVPTHQSDVCATINYSGHQVVVAVERSNIIAVQFHPEKSQDDGLDLLAKFFQSVSTFDASAGRYPS